MTPWPASLIRVAAASLASLLGLATLAIREDRLRRVTAILVSFAVGLVPVAAGGFVYIAAADLIPELHHDRRPRALLVRGGWIALGIGGMALLTLVE